MKLARNVEVPPGKIPCRVQKDSSRDSPPKGCEHTFFGFVFWPIGIKIRRNAELTLARFSDAGILMQVFRCRHSHGNQE